MRLLEEHNPTILIGHNRAKTQGDEADNRNNHPIVTKTGLMLIHNGVLSNEDEVAHDFKLKRDGEVDSEVIVRLIEYYMYVQKKNTIKAIQLMRKHIKGSMAIALLNDKEPKTLYLMASSNPINFAYHIPTGTIYFASTEDILKDGLMEYDHYFHKMFWKERSQNEYVFKELEDNFGVKISTKGWEGFEVEEPPYAGTYDYSNKNNYSNNNNYKDDLGDGFEEDDRYTYNSPKRDFVPSVKPIIVETRGKEDIIKALSEYKDFAPQDPITKPSLYLSDLLLLRLEMIQEEFTSGDYLLWDKGTGKSNGYKRVKSEVESIIDTLAKRKARTKRADITVPKIEDVWLLDNKIYQEDLKDGRPSANGFQDLKWILTHMNVEAMNNLSAAEKMEVMKIKEKIEEAEEIKAEEEETDGEKKSETIDYFQCYTCRTKVFENPCPYCGQHTYAKSLGDDVYYCPDCCSLKEANWCGECGTVNLKTATEAVGKKNAQLALVN